MKRAVVIFLLFALAQIIGSAVALLFGNVGSIGQGRPLAELPVSPEACGVALFVVEFLLTLGLLWFYGWADRSLPRPSLPPLGAARKWLALGGMMALSVALSLLLDPLQLDDGGAQLLFEGMKHNGLCVLLLCLVGPACEELVFRRGVLQGMIQAGCSPLWSVVLSSVAFALVHGNLMQMVPAFVSGIALGFCFLRTGNLRLCLPLHVANNVLAVLLMYFPQVEQGITACGTFCCIALGLILLLLSVAALRRALAAPAASGGAKPAAPISSSISNDNNRTDSCR